MKKITEFLENLTPILVRPSTDSLTISLSKRFFLFQMMGRIINVIEEDPHLNFVALLKSYKMLGRILSGTIKEFYRDRNKLYFKNFFIDRSLYELVKQDLEYIYPKNKDLRMTITKRGVIVYDNYKKNQFNVLLLTVHSGTWIPESLQKKFSVSDKDRFREEDIDTHKIYSDIVLNKGGIWIDNKQSRFIIDFNRAIERAIYDDYRIHTDDFSEIWSTSPTKREYIEIFNSYREFYFTLARVVDIYRFNIVFDGHSMKDLPDRPMVSIGTRYNPNFYMPIVQEIKKKMVSMGYSPVRFDYPWGGGFILKWLNRKFPDMFIISMEVNKRIYMNDERTKSYKEKIDKLSSDLSQILDLEPKIRRRRRYPKTRDKVTKGAKNLPSYYKIFMAHRE